MRTLILSMSVVHYCGNRRFALRLLLSPKTMRLHFFARNDIIPAEG